MRRLAGRINKAWDWRCGKQVLAGSFNLELQASATDDGINIALAEKHGFLSRTSFDFCIPLRWAEVLEQAVLTSPIFSVGRGGDGMPRGHGAATISGRERKCRCRSRRMRADDLLASIFQMPRLVLENLDSQPKSPDHPLVCEVMKDALTEAMDVKG